MGSVYVGMPWGELSGLCVRFASFIDIGVCWFMWAFLGLCMLDF